MAASIWRGRLAFGMGSIPVRLYKAARRERIRFHHVYQPAAEPVEQIEEPERPTPRDAIHEIPKGAPVAPAVAPVAPVVLERVRNLPVGPPHPQAIGRLKKASVSPRAAKAKQRGAVPGRRGAACPAPNWSGVVHRGLP